MAISVNEEGSIKSLGIEFDDSWRINGIDLVYDDSVAYDGGIALDYSLYISKFNAARAIKFPKPISAYRLLIRYNEVITQYASLNVPTTSYTSDYKYMTYQISYCNPKILYQYSWIIKTSTSSHTVPNVCNQLGDLRLQTANMTGNTTSIKILGTTPENGGSTPGSTSVKYWNHSKIFAMY